MYRIKVTGYVQYLEGEIPETSLQDRTYGTNLADIKYSNSFRDPSVLDRNFSTEEEARLAMEQSYRGVDDYGLGLTWTVVRRGSIVVTGAEAIAYAEKKGEALYVFGNLGEADWQVDFAQAVEMLEHEPNRLYTTVDPYYISELVAVNPAKSQIVTMSSAGENVALYRARGLGQDLDCWWYYLKVDAKSEVINPENPDPKVAAALHLSETELRRILDYHLLEAQEAQHSGYKIGA